MATVNVFRAEQSELAAFAAGQVIFSAGDPGDLMYVVHEGEVELHIKGHLVDSLGEGGVLGEMALIDHAPRVATAVAKTACKLMPVSEKRFMFMVQQTPFFALQMLRVMAERLRRMDERL